MLAAAQALTDVQSAVLSDSTTVAILYKDGTEQIIDLLPVNGSSNDLNPATATAASKTPSSQMKVRAQHLTSDVALPTGRTAYLYDSAPISFAALGLPYPPTQALEPWFENAGYTTVASAGSVSDLTNVKNAAVFVLNAHGAIGQASAGYQYYTTLKTVFGIGTSVPVTDDNVTALLDVIKTGEVGIYTNVSYRDVDGQLDWRTWDTFFFTPQFVRDKMTFAPNSVLVMNVCSLLGTDPAAKDMVDAFFDAGAGAVLGWDDKAGSLDAVDTTWFFLDRVLGAGSSASGGYGLYHQDVPNRPFSVGSVYEEISATKPAPAKHQFNNPDYGNVLQPQTVNLNTAAYIEPGFGPVYATFKLQFSPNNIASNSAISLVPTISSLSLQNNKNQLILTGDFGGSSTDRSVTIDTAPMDATWTSNTVTITSLPPTVSGNVQVTINGSKSNQILINQWNEVPLTMTTYNGSSTRTVTCSVNLRTSFDTLRQAPDADQSTDPISTDNVVLENGQCSFVSTDPSAGGDIPWFDNSVPGGTVPATGATVWSVGSAADGKGGGTVELSIQAAYASDSITFLDTSATKGAGQDLVFDDSSGGLAAGLSTQYGGASVLDTFQWAATGASWTPLTVTQPQHVKGPLH